MRSRLMRAAIAAATILSLNGCADLPVVGESLSGVTAPVMAMLDPVLAPFFPKVEPTPDPALAIRRRRRRPLAPEGTAVASGSIGTGSVQVAPAVTYAAWAERNKRFDRLRTEGLMRLYRGQAAGALEAFKQAQALRPEDPQISRLVAMVQNPQIPTPVSLPRPMSGDSVPEAPESGLPAGVSPELLKRAQQFSQQQQQQGAAPGAPQGGDQPSGLFN
ncbi:hypothetical protein J7643_15155 [bacterium]|nr:hypothetical protein [bacterium]